MTRLPKAIATGKLHFGDRTIDCYVLEDGRRVISQRGIIAGIFAKSSGKEMGNLGLYLGDLSNNSNMLAAEKIIEFDMPSRGRAKGREATYLVDLCEAILSSNRKRPFQPHVQEAALAVLIAVAKVGIYALVDEATGYQQARKNDELQRVFDRLLRHQAAKWAKTFPESLPRALAPLWGIHYTGGAHPRGLQTAYAQIYDIVYGSDVSGEIRGRRKASSRSTKNHQWLKSDSRELLQRDLEIIELIARQSATRKQFWARLRNHYHNEPLQLAFG